MAASEVRLEAGEAAELAELLPFPSGWLVSDSSWRPREWCMAPSGRFITFSQLSIGLAA
jgi:hypothetical protein